MTIVEKQFSNENDTNKVILRKESVFGPRRVNNSSAARNFTQNNNDQVTFVFRPIASFVEQTTSTSTSTTTTTTTTTAPNSFTSLTTPTVKLTASSRPLRFLKMLPAVKLSVDQERKQLKFDKLNHMLEKKLVTKQNKGDFDLDPSYELDEQKNNKQRTHRKYTTRTMPFAVLMTNSSRPNGLNISKVLSSTLSWTSSFIDSTSAGFFPSKTNSKPFMQTYKINQTKKLPNQFASLRLNYAGNQAQTKQPYIRCFFLLFTYKFYKRIVFRSILD